MSRRNKVVRFDQKEFNFVLSTSGLELMQGLGGWENLENYDGMLFDFGCSDVLHMWAKGLQFPVDVAFIDEEGVIVQFGHLDPDKERSFTLVANALSRYALEVPVGFFENENIKIGDKFEL